ncbi:MAG: iron-sulfur cluster assembly scaffold protein [Acidobacteria bacterium]|nr:iron-sulfur cluster assembly scaffold protein [Acidobacteriota bacterium]MBV9625865.1 iron-sulfur cluster assembly scaffold protein [Acidobacteriota bacterium]
MYSAKLLDHFEHPRNAGVVNRPDASVQLDNPACGDLLKLTARISNGAIAELKFQAQGCVPAIASGSALTELILGKNLNEAARVSREELVAAVGGLPEASIHASHLAMDALAALLKKLRLSYRVPAGQ